MVIEIKLNCCQEFYKLIENYDSGGWPVFILFTGPWCPWCMKAKPFIEEAKLKLPDKAHFITLEVLTKDRVKFRDPVYCPIKTDRRIELTFFPTILLWGTAKKLVGASCTKPDLLEMLFAEVDDDVDPKVPDSPKADSVDPEIKECENVYNE